MSEEAYTGACTPTEDAQYCAVPTCRYSAASLQQWNTQTCPEHKHQHSSCGCKPNISLYPLPTDDNLKEQWLRAFNLPSDSALSGVKQIQICSVHFKDCNSSEKRPVPLAPLLEDGSHELMKEVPIHQDLVTLSDASSLEKKQNHGDRELTEDGQKKCEDTDISVLSSGLKRPADDDADGDDVYHAAKKLCQENKEDVSSHEPSEDREDTASPASSVKSSSTKTSPSQLGKPKYRASSPTIMTTRGKRTKDLNKEFNNPGSRQEGSVPHDQPLDDGSLKKNGTSCVVLGCRVTGWSNPGVKWYRIPKDDRLRRIWLTQIGRPEFEPKDYHRICSTHFVGGRKTFDSIIPTIDVPTTVSYEPTKSQMASGSTPNIQLKNQSSASKKTFLSNKSWYSRWSITGNSTGSMCCIPGCKSTRRRNLALKYYRFPKEENLRYQWLSSIGLRNFMPRDNSRVCSTHFEDGARSDKNSIPTTFSVDTIALRNVKVEGQQQQYIKEEPTDLTEKTAAEHAFYRQMSPRKQSAPQKLTKKWQKTYGNYCCVPGCGSKYVNCPNLSFYRIPGRKKPDLRRQWIETIGADNITTKEARVCSLHFKGGHKGEGSRVPTIFPDGPRPIPRQDAVKESPNKSKTEWDKHPPMSNPQSNIETLLHASNILSQREAKSRSSTPPSSIGSPVKTEAGHLLPETPRGSSCMVPGCGNTRSNCKGRVRWYRVPKDEARRKLWLNAIGWPNAVPTDTTRICSAHFPEGIYRKKGDKAVPTIFPPKPKDWQARHPQFIEGVKVELAEHELMQDVPSVSPTLAPIRHPSSPRGSSPRGEHHGALPFVTRNHFQAHPYGPTMLRPEVFERSPKQHTLGESRGVTCCVSRCHNNTKRTHGLRWYRIPVDPITREQWTSFIRATRPDFTHKNHHRVCSAHFKGGMKISKSSVPSIYDQPYNRRFLPPNYQQYTGSQRYDEHQWHNQQQQQQQDNSYQQQHSGIRQGVMTDSGNDMAGPSGDAPVGLTKLYRIENPNTPIIERSILPLAYREQKDLVCVKQQVEVDPLHDLSVPINGEYDPIFANKASDDDLSISSIPLPGAMEQKRRVGGGGQCYVPRCTNTRRSNPGLKWYRIPKDPDLRTLWLDNIGRSQAEPKPHNRICSEHFEGGYKQFNTSIPTVEKWSQTSQYVYTGRPVVDSTSSEIGSALLAVDDHPVTVDASFPSVTPSAAQMQSLADSLTALAADYVVASGNTGETFSEGRETPISCANDPSRSNDSMMFNSDHLADSSGRSPSSFSSRSSSVVSYTCSPRHDIDSELFINQDNGDSPIVVAGRLELGSTSTPIFTSSSKQLIRPKSSPSHQELQIDGAPQELAPLVTESVNTAPVGDELTKKSGEPASMDGQQDDGDVVVNPEKEVEAIVDASKEEKSNPEERIKHLEGVMQTMCEELRLKEQKLKEKDFDLTSCQHSLKEKEAELERIKRKCLMMSIRLNSFRKLAQTDL